MKKIIFVIIILAVATITWASTIVQPVTTKSGWSKFATVTDVNDSTGLTGAEAQYANLLLHYNKQWLVVGEDKAIQIIRFRGLLTTAAATLELWKSSGMGDGEYLGLVTLVAPGASAQQATAGGYYFDNITVSAASGINLICVNCADANTMGFIAVDTEGGDKIIPVVKTLTGTIYMDARGYQ